MSMFEFDDFDEGREDDALNDLIAAYEASQEEGGNAYFDSEALEEIATHYFEQGRFETALDVIDRLIATHPYSSDAWLRRGVLLPAAYQMFSRPIGR